MQLNQHKLRLVAIGLLCLLNIGFGFYSGQLPMLLSGAAGLVYAGEATKRVLQAGRPGEAGVAGGEAVRS